MADVSNEVVYEVLKQLQGQTTRVQEDLHGIRQELSAIRGHIAAVQREVHNSYETLDSVDERVERIGLRLERGDKEA